ncbi:MAG: hypothetical protein WBK55_08600 [Alphaproteobacteria bacterium]
MLKEKNFKYTKDETEPASGRLADVLYTLGLIAVDERQFHHLLKLKVYAKKRN